MGKSKPGMSSISEQDIERVTKAVIEILGNKIRRRAALCEDFAATPTSILDSLADACDEVAEGDTE